MTSKRRRTIGRVAAVALALLPIGYLVAWAAACETIGAAADGARLERMRASKQWHGDGFGNLLPRVDGPAGEMMTSWFFGKQPHAVPEAPIPVVARRAADYRAPPPSGLRVTWLGHSTLLLEIDGARVLIDPVWGPRASPFSFAGPERFYEMPLPLGELPAIDAVLISHDHYDHLDAPTVQALAASPITWAVPLGVGADLEAWGVPAQRIAELDWWESTSVGGLQLTALPARHFSGRWLNDQSQTLWAGWAVVGAQHRVYYSGDTALFPELKDIGARFGPFDLTLIEVGAYDKLWADVHLGPEQGVLAHRLVGGKVMLPVHWGLFDLALHSWTEPIERVLVEAARTGVTVVSPRPGDLVEPGALAAAGEPEPAASRWWPAVPWRTVDQAPAFSSHTEALRSDAERPPTATTATPTTTTTTPPTPTTTTTPTATAPPTTTP